MGRKTTMEKGKGKQSDVQYDKCHRTRCSPSELARTYAVLSNEKKALVHKMGFGALAENVSNYNFSNLIMMELVDSFHILDSTIRTNIGRFKVDATKKVVLCPNNLKPLSPKTLPTILDVTNPRAMNWGWHVYSFLLNSIMKMKKKNLKSADGCVFALLIIYIQETHFGVDSEEADAQPPWLVYWKDSILKRRIKYEFEDPADLFSFECIIPDLNAHLLILCCRVCVRSVRRRTKKRDEAINAEPLQPRQHTKANANAADAIGENVGIIERRTKKRHEAINAAPLQPPQQGEADANPDATIDALADPSTQVNVNQEDHNKDHCNGG
ncbi:hypothetical protein PIB30_090180 [Stylosanthes scabra]|uniref:Uncharacterized protein n=1 Tax=Stylosanthes scabra TaxID=79078 RepID=A0ABU6TTX3_9FABA|nr:hypothetical protein [Stylosanthes scabra]